MKGQRRWLILLACVWSCAGGDRVRVSYSEGAADARRAGAAREPVISCTQLMKQCDELVELRSRCAARDYEACRAFLDRLWLMLEKTEAAPCADSGVPRSPPAPVPYVWDCGPKPKGPDLLARAWFTLTEMRGWTDAPRWLTNDVLDIYYSDRLSAAVLHDSVLSRRHRQSLGYRLEEDLYPEPAPSKAP